MKDTINNLKEIQCSVIDVVPWALALDEAIRCCEESSRPCKGCSGYDLALAENVELKEQIETLETVPLNSKFFKEFKEMKERIENLPTREEKNEISLEVPFGTGYTNRVIDAIHKRLGG